MEVLTLLYSQLRGGDLLRLLRRSTFGVRGRCLLFLLHVYTSSVGETRLGETVAVETGWISGSYHRPYLQHLAGCDAPRRTGIVATRFCRRNCERHESKEDFLEMIGSDRRCEAWVDAFGVTERLDNIRVGRCAKGIMAGLGRRTQQHAPPMISSTFSPPAHNGLTRIMDHTSTLEKTSRYGEEIHRLSTLHSLGPNYQSQRFGT